MIHIVTSAGFIIVAVIVAFGLTALVTVTIANAMAIRQERGERESRQEPLSSSPPHVPDSASHKRGA